MREEELDLEEEAAGEDIDIDHLLSWVERGDTLSQAKVDAAMRAVSVGKQVPSGPRRRPYEPPPVWDVEHQDWYAEVQEVLSELSLDNPASLKRRNTIMYLAWADFSGTPRWQVFEDPRTLSSYQFYSVAQREPQFARLSARVREIMNNHLVDQEARAVRLATFLIRAAAPRAAGRIIALSDDANPFVALNAARHILNAADKGTADKGGAVTISPADLAMLAEQAAQELEAWAQGNEEEDGGAGE